tara:strand:+ start:611 stop:2761 length:2151 start_codon:yes stop_codon:yes gene_type:complete
MSDDIIEIEVDGKSIQAKKGQMIIEATDTTSSYVPRFCYHSKLSIAANCRMCLVEVEKASKPLPACATPVSEGMKIFTRSAYAIAAQKATMEFLLINHPLDCPICDQGGECELQDIAMGYGRGISRYNDNKRVVKDKNIGPLVSTDMTRCIHCTRCVRFGEEITGVQDLGTVMRGEDMRIDTYVEKSIDHELSSNIIDLCPVGALNNKPYRYSARSWEMIQHETIAAHDCVGSNLYAHVLRGKVKRIVPRENEAINETWISDRDRFSYEGIYSDDRLMSPMIKKDDKWQEISWKDALIEVVEKLKVVDQKSSAFLASPNSTLEEFYLLTKLSNDLSINNVDHRLRVVDFTDQDNDPKIPLLGMNIAEIEKCKQIVVIGSDIRKEAPIIGHRIRKAALAGTQIGVINENINEYFFDISAYLSGSMIENLLGLLNVLGGESPKEMQDISKQIKPTEKHKEMAAILNSEGKGHLILGHLAINHSYASVIRTLSAKIAHLTGSELGFVTEGSNAAGAHLMGMLPHRGFAGVSQDIVGKNVQEMTENSLDLLLLFNAEPGNDLPSFSFEKAGHSFVIAMTPYATEKYKMTADIMLPIGTFAETSGTYINCENRSQSFAGIANPVGESRPGWKVLCAIGSMLGMSDFELESSESVLDEISQKLNDMPTSNIKPNYSTQNITNSKNFLDSNLVQRTPMYEVDSVLRHAASLQLTPEACRSGKT